MRQRLTIVAVFLTLVLALLWLRHRTRTQAPESHHTADLPPIATNAEPGVTAPRELPSVIRGGRPPTNREQVVAWQTEIEQRQQQAIQQGKDEWRTPIEFYGKVVDENDRPVPDAQIDFACNDLSADGTSLYRAASDNQGLFAITGIQGKLLTAKVSKAGYYTSKRDNAAFNYAGENVNFTPDATNPIVFHLRKIGKFEPLLAMAGSTAVPKDGSLVGLSLAAAKIAPLNEADLMVQCWTEDEGKRRGEKYNWRCLITVPGGGIQEYAEEFPFMAPQSGYQSSVEINMLANLQGEWHDKAARNYFVKLGNGNYARFRFEMIPYGEHFFLIESYVNPSGSRNLEGDPDVRRTRLGR